MVKKSKDPGTGPPSRVRVAIRLHPDLYERVKYWADRESEKSGVSVSANDLVVQAIEELIARMNGDYDLPTMEQARLNQLIDLITSLSGNMVNLERTVLDMNSSIVGLARGDNYLLDDDESGELDE